MVLMEIMSWWYTAGWLDFCRALIEKIKGALSFFSIGLLLRTLFAPFRQISANSTGQALDAKVNAFFDRLVSRMVGAIVRIGLMLAGIIVATVLTLVSAVLIVAWLLVPLLPIAGIVLTVMGVA